jgi:hypothetical protein
MKRLLYLVGLTLLVGLLPLLVQGQEAEERSLLQLQVATFDPLLDGEPSELAGPAAPATPNDTPYYIVQFNGLIEEAWLSQAETLGATALGYIPDNAYLMRLAPDDVPKIRSIPAVRWIGAYRSGYKIAPSLVQPDGARLSSSGEVELRIVAFPGEPVAATRQVLRAAGATISQVAETDLGTVFRVTAPEEAIPQLATLPGISWIEPYFMPQQMNLEARRVMNAESVWTDNGYFGAGQIVAVSDSGLSLQEALNADFAGRLRRAFAPSRMNLANPDCRAKTTWTDTNGHGTHVAGSVLGNGANSGSNPEASQYTNSFAGVAPEAELVFMALNTDGSSGIQCVDDNGDFIARGYQEGARISTNSWGGPTGGTFSQPEFGGYNILASIVDNYLWNHKDYLVLYAAGNSGPNPDTIGSPGVAKNILTVGAAENNRPDVTFNGRPESRDPDRMISFSSRGPTDDGRVKPDVVAPGTSVLSVRAAQAAPDTVEFFGLFQPQPTNLNYAYSRGTSMATPLTAGAAVLVREWLVKDRDLTNPSAALMKALMIHGAAQLPGAVTPNFDSGWGRVDLKNTIGARYAIFDDHAEGLVTNDVLTYTVEVVGSNAAGTLFAGKTAVPRLAGAPADEVVTLMATAPLQATVTTGENPFSLQTIPGFDAPAEAATIRTATAEGKADLAPVRGRALSQPEQTTAGVIPRPAGAGAAPQSFLQGMVGGGDFEDPDWTNIWSDVWLGYGIPLRTSVFEGGVVLNGNHSVWLGGTPIEDSIWYPLSFPETIASDFPSSLAFLFQMENLDPTYDFFCVGLVDASGYLIGGNAGIEDCYDNILPGEPFVYERVFTPAEKAALEGETGYLVLGIFSDGVAPHMSTYVDDIVLGIDFADVTLEATPPAGPPGTTFLLTGSNNAPYAPVDICVTACSVLENYLGTVYADARGDIAAYLPTSPTADLPGTYTIESINIFGRSATTTITLLGNRTPALTVTPPAGPAGSTFTFSGTDFLPNDTEVAVEINGEFLGVTGSDATGAVGFTLRTTSNIPPGTYNVQVTDSANRSATTTFDVTALPSGSPTMSVTPASGSPGAEFTFTGSNFAPNAAVSFSLDGQPVGEADTNGSGGFVVTLQTASDIAPGSYTLVAGQGSAQASAGFQITGGGTEPQPGDTGLFVTLAWTDPPAREGTAKALVNNLNLRVIAPGGTITYGNGGTGPDTVNNVETVRLQNPLPGTYTVVVEAQQVVPAYGSQPFALVATTRQNFGTNSTNVNVGAGDERLYLPLVVR